MLIYKTLLKNPTLDFFLDLYFIENFFVATNKILEKKAIFYYTEFVLLKIFNQIFMGIASIIYVNCSHKILKQILVASILL